MSSSLAPSGPPTPAASQHLGKLMLTGVVAAYWAEGGQARRLVTEVLQAADHRQSGAPDHD